MKLKKLIIIIISLIVVIVGIIVSIKFVDDKTEIKSISSKSQLKKIYNNDNYNYGSTFLETLIKIPTLPWSLFYFDSLAGSFDDYSYSTSTRKSTGGVSIDAITTTDSAESSSSISGFLNSGKSLVTNTSDSLTTDYSKTNIQVENVDEADITKTDGNYIYSLSDNNVIISDVRDPNDVKLASKINVPTGAPEDLLLYNNKLVVISSEGNYSKQNTIVYVYNIDNKEQPYSIKSYTLYEPYYTTRCIGNMLYVISSGTLRKENSEIATYYKEDYDQKDIGLNNIKYLKDIKTNTQTLISSVDLNNLEQNINVQSYLIDIDNAYISENSIYLADTSYEYSKKNKKMDPPIYTLFTLKGVFGPASYVEKRDYSYSSSNYTKTNIYKFDITNGKIEYSAKTKLDGQIINQFSLDEFNNNLRVAIHNNDGSKVVVLDCNLNKLGETSSLAKGEKMYSSRFIGNKAYLVTYQTVDPLYVIDLSNPNNPKVLGELKIPGYSTYLHPYDETHLIGIGMETKETVNRNSQGKVTSTTARIVGMKMALFDVSNLQNPIQISSTVIGDSRTTSAILTNHKALLFSKEKELIAIPVNNYAEDFEINDSTDTSTLINSYTNYNKKYISEGYLVYKINLTDGFKQKGTITHKTSTSNTGYYYYSKSRLLRGMYINNNIFTVSEDELKVNSLEDLKEISKLNLREQNSSNSLIQNKKLEKIN